MNNNQKIRWAVTYKNPGHHFSATLKVSALTSAEAIERVELCGLDSDWEYDGTPPYPLEDMQDKWWNHAIPSAVMPVAE